MGREAIWEKPVDILPQLNHSSTKLFVKQCCRCWVVLPHFISSFGLNIRSTVQPLVPQNSKYLSRNRRVEAWQLFFTHLKPFLKFQSTYQNRNIYKQVLFKENKDRKYRKQKRQYCWTHQIKLLHPGVAVPRFEPNCKRTLRRVARGEANIFSMVGKDFVDLTQDARQRENQPFWPWLGCSATAATARRPHSEPAARGCFSFVLPEPLPWSAAASGRADRYRTHSCSAKLQTKLTRWWRKEITLNSPDGSQTGNATETCRNLKGSSSLSFSCAISSRSVALIGRPGTRYPQPYLGS